MALLPGMKAPQFQGVSFLQGLFSDISLDDYKNKWLLLFFYPTDFGHIAASELLELNKRQGKLKKMGFCTVGVSRENVVVHEQFERLSTSCGGVNGLNFPLLEDVSGVLSREYGMVLNETSYNLRGYFIINPEGLVCAREMIDLDVGIDMEEVVRVAENLLSVANLSLEDENLLENPVDSENISFSKLIPARSYYENNFLRKEDYPIYSTGRRQSPIDIPVSQTVEDSSLTAVTFNYIPDWGTKHKPTSRAQPTTIKNSGHGFYIPVGEHFTGRIYDGPFGPREYRLVSVHAHWGPSEHSVDGHHYDAELHLIHYNLRYSSYMEAKVHQDGVAGVAIFLQENKDQFNMELEKIREVLPHIKERGREMETAVPISFQDLLPESRDYFTYDGSYTTPAYSEVVKWVVMIQPIQISPACLQALSTLSYGGPKDKQVTMNSRSTCDKEDRIIRMYVHKEENPDLQN